MNDHVSTPFRDVLSKLAEDLYLIAGSNEPDSGQLADKTLDYLRVVRQRIRRLDAATAKAKKIVAKPSK